MLPNQLFGLFTYAKGSDTENFFDAQLDILSCKKSLFAFIHIQKRCRRHHYRCIEASLTRWRLDQEDHGERESTMKKDCKDTHKEPTVLIKLLFQVKLCFCLHRVMKTNSYQSKISRAPLLV